MLGIDDFTEIGEVADVFLFLMLNRRPTAQEDLGQHVEQDAHALADGLVIVEQELPPLGEERAQVVFIILEEGRVAIG